MAVTYPQGGIPGMIVSRDEYYPSPDTVRVQLIPMRPPPDGKISSPNDILKFVKDMEDADREYTKIIHLDTQNQVVGIETVSIGNISASIVHPRETIKAAILNNSAATIFVHNHPSGICKPSNDDIKATNMLADAFKCVGIKLLDSIIVGKGCYYSFEEMGHMPSIEIPETVVGDIKSDIIHRIQCACTFDELNPIITELNFYPLSAQDKQEIVNIFNNRRNQLHAEIPFGKPIPVQGKPRVIGGPTREDIAAAERRKKAAESCRTRGQQTLTGAVSTSKRLSQFGVKESYRRYI